MLPHTRYICVCRSNIFMHHFERFSRFSVFKILCRFGREKILVFIIQSIHDKWNKTLRPNCNSLLVKVCLMFVVNDSEMLKWFHITEIMLTGLCKPLGQFETLCVSHAVLFCYFMPWLHYSCTLPATCFKHVHILPNYKLQTNDYFCLLHFTWYTSLLQIIHNNEHNLE